MHKPLLRPLRWRQIHLDFHTSEHIPAVGARFDADRFVSTFQSARVNSVTLFAKCHHGWSYYPTEVGEPHPNLARPNLLGEMVKALNAADIETPIYISAQWDERNARLHPEWRVRCTEPSRFDPGQLTAGWHTLCLYHQAYRNELRTHALEVVKRYNPAGLFFDIVLTPGCVCSACLATMEARGLDAENPADRQTNDEWVNERFRSELSKALWAEHPDLRIFYNCGHIHKMGAQRFSPYSHLELESLPTGGWGYDHFPTSARYAATLGIDYLGHTGKFHTSWGEFGGFKHPDALDYECANMAALGSKCLVGDQLHPDGDINADTYTSIRQAYERIEKLEPFLEGASQVSEIAILSAEHFNPGGDRNHVSDDGAAQMLLELQLPFDVIDREARFENYRLLILPDDVSLDPDTAQKLAAFLRAGGRMILSDRSGLDPNGRRINALDLGFDATGNTFAFDPCYLQARKGQLALLPETPFVLYGTAREITAPESSVLADLRPSYFNRSYKHFCSHQHTPDDPEATPLGPGAVQNEKVGYLPFAIFAMYHQVGQPLYKYLVQQMIEQFLPDPVLRTDLSSGGRATLTYQPDHQRHILHLLFAVPQVRGKSVYSSLGAPRVMEMIEDVQTIGQVKAHLRLPRPPSRVFDAITNDNFDWEYDAAGYVTIKVPSMRIHTAIIFEGGQ